MGKVASLVRYPLTHAADNLAALGPLLFLGFRELALCLRQFMFFGTEKARIGDLFAVRQRCERHQTDIYSNCAAFWCKWFWFRFNAKTHKPLTCSRAPDRSRLDLTFDRTMQNDLQRADLAQHERFSFQPYTITVLRIGDAVIAALALE